MLFSDSDFSVAREESDDDDFKMSDNDSDDDDDFDLDNERTKAVREGFSLHNSSVESTPGKDNEWLATQSATKNRRVSPRNKKQPKGITGAIVGAIKGETDCLVIPKKKKPSLKQKAAPTTTTDQKSGEAQSQQPPMKKRKVSLSPTDSLAKNRASLLGLDAKKQKEVIDLMLDDSDDSDDEILAFKRDRMAKPEIAPQRLSPSLLAAASKQQKEHVEASKKKQKTETPQASETKRSLSKVSGVTYAELPDQKPIETNNSVPRKSKKDDKAVSAALASTNDAKSCNNKSDASSKETKAKKTKSKKSTEPKSGNVNTEVPVKSSKPKEAKAKKSKPASSTTVTAKSEAPEKKLKSTESTQTVPKETKGAPKVTKATKSKKKDAAVADTLPKPPPPKKKKKRITFEDELLQKMFMTCRPYAVRDLVQLMGKITSEASVNFCLLSLIDKKWVIKKEFKSGNRTKELYWANQESKDKKLWALECLQLPSSETIRESRLELASLQQKQKSLFREIEEVEKTPSNDQLSQLCQSAQSQVDELSAKLEAMKRRIASSGAPQTKKPLLGQRRGLMGRKPKAKLTPLQLKKRINSMRDHWIKRKRKCMDFCEALADGMEKKVKDVVTKVLELETDEAENAILPPKHVV